MLRSEGYLRILNEEKKLTFAVIVGNHESHHQISVLEFDTREKIEKKMAETGVQVSEELERNDNSKRSDPIPEDIQALVDEAAIK